ncbi:MAG: outer membrane lipoprotein carrier protein LolA [Bacteroidetes bacterium]|nr:outer membrane lipoprotein carrier protein LolA [Bacteroidota bacterium]
MSRLFSTTPFIGFFGLIFFFAQASPTVCQAQGDAKARDLLRRMNANYKSFRTMTADFSFTLDHPAQKINEQQRGKLEIKGKKYRLEMKQQTIMTDGSVLWVVLKDAKEVNVSDYEPAPDELTPTSVFTLYEKGFEPYMQAEGSTATSKVIDLVPIDKKKPYFKIKLSVDPTKALLTQAVVMNKDGSRMTYVIRDFKSNNPINDNQFQFQKAQFPQFEVIDLR